MSQSIDLKIKALKSAIFAITSHHTGGERARQDLALSVFVKFSLGVMLNQLVARYRNYGITDLELAEHILIDDTHFALDRKLFDTLNPEALATSVRLYKELVEALPAFSDVLMSVIEEMYLADKKRRRFRSVPHTTRSCPTHSIANRHGPRQRWWQDETLPFL
ncbi:hypothetical protein [Pseudomonas veronii]